jgi:hypothetical protein
VPPQPLVPPELTDDAFRGSAAVGAGLLSRRQLTGSTWRRVFRDVYIHRDVPVDHELRARAALLLLPHGVVTGCSAAVLWGVDLAGPQDDVELTLPPRSGMVRVQGLRTRRAALDPRHVWSPRGVAATSPEETAVRLASALPVDAAVVALDQLIATRCVDLVGIRRHVELARGPGSARARSVAALADGLAASPQETRLRLLIGRSSLPAPIAQYRVLLDGRFVARVDFAWPEKRVALEYDGLWHAEAGQFARDRQRLNRLREAGWAVVFVTAADLHDPVGLIARIAAALAA